MSVRIYYEDTDVAGVVYYANYLRYLERARTEWLRAAGWDLATLQRNDDAVFVVRRIEADYLQPARLGDLLSVTCEPEAVGASRIDIRQRVLRGHELLLQARVIAAYIGASDGRPRRMPERMRSSLQDEPRVQARRLTAPDSPS
ncbi:MAG: tol-pal system-associated acyl-CoA thioesterase [Casimicrobiaceae bacterium]|nr:tol-pal system-associated acyl-CoA thioesterase [Casimicrobiaceae bacterium]MCX8099282.1 tol-pal system-associated acyl-CoA thioesterase [Casimicrobiaceae bacterium]